MLYGRKRESKKHLAPVSSKVIYSQKLTESHCRSFIYFYSECPGALALETLGRADADSSRLQHPEWLLTAGSIRMNHGGVGVPGVTLVPE